MAEQSCFVDFEAFSKETGIEGETLRELYQVFLDELTDQKTRFIEAFENTDYTKLQKIIHNIKGISGSYKALDVHIKSKEIDALLKEGNTKNLVSLLPELVYIIEGSVLAIRKHLDTF